jgi:hypothetical protein
VKGENTNKNSKWCFITNTMFEGWGNFDRKPDKKLRHSTAQKKPSQADKDGNDKVIKLTYDRVHQYKL